MTSPSFMFVRRAYENRILPQSFTRPYIIVFYGDLCFPCVEIEHILEKIMNELESIGIGFATVHSQHENVLAQKIGVRTLPHIISLVDGDVRTYLDNQISLAGMIEFVKRSIPTNLVTEVNDRNYVDFLSAWKDNRVRVLFVNEDRFIKLQYYIVAFYFRERIAFGHVVADQASDEILEQYHVNPKMSCMLLFNEDISRSTASLSVTELKTQLMKEVLESNKYLYLPRVASQAMFDQLCPIESLASKHKLCVMLVSSDTPDNDVKLEAMRNFMRESKFTSDRFKFMYIFREKQTQFVKTLTSGFKKGNINRGVHVVVLWRRQIDHVYYEWLDNEWDLIDANYINDTKQKLAELLTHLSQNTMQFSNDAKVLSLIDESAKSLISRIVKRLLLVTENISDNISRTDPMPIFSICLSLVFIVLVGYVMAYFM